MNWRLGIFALASSILACITVGCGSKRAAPDIRLGAAADGTTTTATLVGAHVRDSDLEALAKQPSILELSLQECSGVSDAGLAKLKAIIPNLKKVSLIRVPVSDEGLQHLAGATSLTELTLAHTNVKGSGLASLSGLPLVRLTLQSRTVQADALSALSQLTNLEELELQCQDITIASLPNLTKLTKLNSLVAYRTPVGKGGMSSLKGLTNLRKLILFSADIDDDSIDAINTLTGLEEAELASASISDSGLKRLNLPSLKRLSLDSCSRVTDEGLAQFVGMPQLERLMLGGTSVQGKDLTPLANLAQLKEVLLMGNQFKGNAETIKALKEKLPNCEVSIMRG